MIVRNKRGDIGDIFTYIAIFFTITIIFLVLGKVALQMKDNLSTQFGDSPEANSSIQKLGLVPRLSDIVLFITFIGIIIGLIATVLMIRTHPLFFVAFIIASFLLLIVAAIFSNVYEVIRDTPSLTEVSDQYTITNYLYLYLPLFFFIILLIVGVILYSKSQGGGAVQV